jgi:hypothetical protein
MQVTVVTKICLCSLHNHFDNVNVMYKATEPSTSNDPPVLLALCFKNGLRYEESS